MTREWNYKSENNLQSRDGLKFDIIKLDQKLRQELAQTGRVDYVEKDIFAWIAILSARELAICRELVVELTYDSKILDNSLLKDVIKFSKPNL